MSSNVAFADRPAGLPPLSVYALRIVNFRDNTHKQVGFSLRYFAVFFPPSSCSLLLRRLRGIAMTSTFYRVSEIPTEAWTTRGFVAGR